MSGRGIYRHRPVAFSLGAMLALGLLAACAHPAANAGAEVALDESGVLELAAGPAEGAVPAPTQVAAAQGPERMLERNEEAMIAAFLLGVRQDRTAIMFLMH